MEIRPREILFYETAENRAPCRDWLDALQATHTQAHAIILSRLDRVEDGNFGDCKRWTRGGGIWELRIDFGPGYRVYFGEDGDFVILLCGGTKKTQYQDSEAAKKYWEDYNA